MEVGVNTIDGVKVTEQLPDERLQIMGENVPVKFASKLTVPVGSLAVPLSESVTVAVQVVLAPGRVEVGAHSTETETDLDVAVTVKVREVLVEWSLSPE